MADIDWQPLPPLWPSPAVSTDVGGFTLLVFTEDNVPTWEVRRKAKKVDGRHDLVARFSQIDGYRCLTDLQQCEKPSC